MANELAHQALEITDDNFKLQVLESKKPVLVDFWAPWCGPCRMLAPVLDELAQETVGQFVIGKLDIDQNAQAAHTYGVRSIPALVIFKDGQEVDRLTGVQTKAVLQAKLAAHTG